MRIAVFGTGGVGGYFGGRLAQAGEDVTFIARGKHLQAMQQQGLKVASIKGDFVVQPVQATDNPAEVGPVDIILVGVKAWQVEDAAAAIRPMIGPQTFVVPLQNGVEAPERLIKILGQGQVLGGFCRIVSYVTEPGQITHAGGDPYVAFGELDNSSSEQTQQLLTAFQRTTGLTADVPPNIQVAMWDKFLQISAWSGIGAVTRAPVGVLRTVPETRQMWQQAMQEVVAVAHGHGIPLTEDAITRTMNFIDNLPPHATASMQRDILAGRPSELHILCGGVVRLGRQVNVPTPIQAFIYHALLPQELKAQGSINFSGMTG